MNTLFPMETHLPPGFEYKEGFVSPGEEQFLIELLSNISLHPFMLGPYQANRLVKSYGYDYSFKERSLKQGEPIPDAFHWLIERVASHTHRSILSFAELLVTSYPVGAVINWHRDASPFDLIAGISLASDAVMRFRTHDGSKRSSRNLISKILKRQSLYIISGEARTEWQHSIAAVKAVRFSITLRTLVGAVE